MSSTNFISPLFWQFLQDFWPAVLLLIVGIVVAAAGRSINRRRQRPIAYYPAELLKTAFQFDRVALMRHMQRGTISKAQVDRALSDTHRQIIKELNRR
ncbi:hypothetical protein LMG31884_47250 (plasmid) [Xanthomonas hydrangeae]|uniref:hypothetical protein n=1 Tax=Xanthomonas hydrangeae TaxID=2775159 RepID=UPI001964B8AE|nr:hypothetical protein LMG31884_47250 [Xanthomonas hydrangeae]CAD7741079.1 hypothetical protein LMG31884_47250 [Xanthomonas hydrangeae]CAD7747970.1 hypothetical protein LMG31887_46560 [Xanthomonas hydrangeae]CAD7747971.1 hypothetical protein LMG31887_46560 [Xanthomonas hydrangeae]CAD7748152.1 hypothetical protein LMG31885_44930 [Xanthomonas hydrangeae]